MGNLYLKIRQIFDLLRFHNNSMLLFNATFMITKNNIIYQSFTIPFLDLYYFNDLTYILLNFHKRLHIYAPFQLYIIFILSYIL